MDPIMLFLWGAEEILPPEQEPQKRATVIEKGCCKHCGKKVGRGLHFHEKSCGGSK